MTDHARAFLFKTLSSRKFWAAVTASTPFALAHDWQSFAAVWMGYAGIQGVVDASSQVGSTKARELMAPVPAAGMLTAEDENE